MSLVLPLLLALAGPPKLCLVVHSTGFSDDDTARLVEKAGLEVKRSGAGVEPVADAERVDAECLERPQCARDIIEHAAASGLVWLDATRAGASVMMTVRLLDGKGKVAVDDEANGTADAVLGAEPLITSKVMEALIDDVSRSAADPVVVPDVVRSPDDDDERRKDPLVVKRIPREDPPPPPPPALNTLVITGVATASAGVILAVTGALITAQQLAVLDDRDSLGTEKEAAAVLVPVMVTIGALGGGLLVGGAGLALVGYDDGSLVGLSEAKGRKATE